MSEVYTCNQVEYY